MIKSGDKVFCVSQKLSEQYGFKLDVIYEVDMALNHGGQNILIIKHCPSNGNYAFDVSNFEKVNETNIRRVKISRIKNRMNEK